MKQKTKQKTGKKATTALHPTRAASAASATVNASALARKVGLSKQAVSRKLHQGKTPQEIKTEAARRVADATRRGKLPKFAESQAEKEYYLGQLRKLEFERKRGDLAPVTDLQNWVVDSVTHTRDLINAVPAAVSDQLAQLQTAQEVRTVLTRVILGVLREADGHMSRRAAYHGLRMPPSAPAPVRETLAHYERYVRGAMDGAVEDIPPAERLGSREWELAHPGVSVQEMFQLMQKKKAWDKAMGELLVRRSEWDLQPGSAVPTEPTEATDSTETLQ